MSNKNPNRNDLKRVRKKRKLERKQVAFLLDQKSTDAISCHENGKYLPNLRTALKLEIVYQTPIKYLFSEIYEELKAEIDGLKLKSQQLLPDRNWLRPNPEQLQLEEFCFYSEMLKSSIPNELELGAVIKHVINLSNTSADYKQGKKPYQSY